MIPGTYMCDRAKFTYRQLTSRRPDTKEKRASLWSHVLLCVTGIGCAFCSLGTHNGRWYEQRYNLEERIGAEKRCCVTPPPRHGELVCTFYRPVSVVGPSIVLPLLPCHEFFDFVFACHNREAWILFFSVLVAKYLLSHTTVICVGFQ